MSAISSNHIALALYLALKDKTHAEQTPILKNAVQLLNRKKLLVKKDAVLENLQKIINQESGRLNARVSVSKHLSEHAERELRHMLKTKYKAEHLELEEHLDQSLLDGWRAQVGDEVIDMSAKNIIKQLQEHLTKSE